ncbi:MAG: hypothetical protein IJU23_03525 [Proteobacteria bacterium]|nr:hypothetical protein [Pseudomonadota bacterium]
MKTILPLKTINDTPETFKQFVGAIILHMEKEISSMSMLKGMFIKKSYAAVKSVRPGYVQHIIEVLTRDYISEFSSMHDDFRASQKLPSAEPVPFITYIRAHREEADKHFWRIADDYAAKKSSSLIGKAYKAGRSTIDSHLPLVYEIICSEIDKYTIKEA